jgi:hypothetical protein
VSFYDAVVRPSLGRQRGVVYVLPETRPAAELLRNEPSKVLDHGQEPALRYR